jgi:hypothetical protein
MFSAKMYQSLLSLFKFVGNQLVICFLTYFRRAPKTAESDY